jgi:transcriptional regulator with XRE-family HTH domain
LADIARIAGVSESAVSRALHDSPRVSAATRERIKKIAADLDFEFNSHARSLSTSRSRTIAVIIPDFGDDARRAYYLNLLVGDIRSELKRSGKKLSELASCMKKYPQHMVNVEASPAQKSAFFTDDDIRAIIDDAEEKLQGHGRLVVRPSGTEPLVRIMIEDMDPTLTETLCVSVAERISEILVKY